MKIIITGASGFIGSALVPHLAGHKHELLLVGRDIKRLQENYPGHRYCAYDEIVNYGVDFDACIHLAVMNNRGNGDIKDFRSVNVDLLKRTFQQAKNAGCRKFFNFTSLHASDPNMFDFYSASKREADLWLSRQAGMNIISVRLPAVYSNISLGNLSFLNGAPTLLRNYTLYIIRSLKPIIFVDNLMIKIETLLKCDKIYKEVIFSDPVDNNMIYMISKRLIDILFSLAVLVFGWWIFIILYLAIYFDSSGCPIFSQKRVGKNGILFSCYKFRTMHVGTKHVATHHVDKSVITKVGRMLRSTKLDELPQVFNILKGDLSLVGPRPCLPVQKEVIQYRSDRGVDAITPGITGWAQIQEVDMRDPEKLAIIDSDYVARRSVIFDAGIIIKTFFGAGQGDRLSQRDGTD